MSALSEWELLCAAAGIEQGDAVSVEREDGETVLMVFMNVSRGNVKLRDRDGSMHKFSASSLEEVDGSAMITGKSDEELSVRD